MTPFGEKLRELRKAKNLSQKQMAHDLSLSPAYLSALEHGHRGKPSWALVQQLIAYFGIIWDEAEELEELARISHPKITVDTSGLDPKVTEFVNVIARDIRKIELNKIQKMLKILENNEAAIFCKKL
jgi:transcriptional regulator with XRE-family HTH domain